MQKPDITRLPTSQMMAFCQILGLPQGGDSETKEAMLTSLGSISDSKWAETEVLFQVDQL